MKNVFVQTKNVSNFLSAMREAQKAAPEPLFLVFYGPAGRGKSETARQYAAQEGCVYARHGKGWENELWMLQDLCFELRIDPIPKRKKPAFKAIEERLLASPTPVIIDEADKFELKGLEWIRDLVDRTAAPFALVGEKGLYYQMNRERRFWSRTLRTVEFGPIQSTDILFFAKQALDCRLSPQQGEMLRQISKGDFRPVKMVLRHIEDLMEIHKTEEVTNDLFKKAIERLKKDDDGNNTRKIRA